MTTDRAWLLFCLMAVLWGIPYLFIKVAVAQVSPLTLVFVRTALASLLLLPLATRRRALAGLGGRLGWVMALACVGIAGPFLLISLGEEWIPSSLSGLLVATEPLFVALLAVRVDPTERVRGGRRWGLLVGFAGVVCLLGLDVGPHPALLAGAAMVVAAAFGYATGALIVKRRFHGVPPLGVATAAVTTAAVVLLPGAVLTAPSRVPSPPALAALAVLGVACTALAYLAFYALIGLAGASRAAVITYLNPAVALGEALTWTTALGFVLVVAGSWLSTGGRLLPRGLRLPGLSRPPARHPPGSPGGSG
jgi:drug/metabolite transporter (DMT)-like permease